MLRRSRLVPLLALGICLGTIPSVWAAGKTITYSFESDPVGSPPKGFSFARTGFGRDGRWVVLDVPDARSGKHILAQNDADRTDYRFPLAIADVPSVADVKATVGCKPISGQGDQGCGLVFRYQDPRDYYVARANALEDNVNLYRVGWGIRSQIKGWNGPVASRTWHTLSVTAQRDHLRVDFDGKSVIDTHDGTFKGAGRVGLWTKADSVIWFDDFMIEPLGG